MANLPPNPLPEGKGPGGVRANRPPYGPPAVQGDVDCGFRRNEGAPAGLCCNC